MNYKTSYTHATREAEGGNRNDIILQRALLPAQGQKLSEAFIVNLSDGSILLTEKKYEVNGEKRFLFFRSCSWNAMHRCHKNRSWIL